MRRPVVILIAVVVAIPLLFFLARLSIVALSPTPDDAGDGIIEACAETPNCVSTVPNDLEGNYINPIPFTVERQDAQTALVAVLQELPRTTIVSQDDGYIHAIRRTRWMSYVDDMEFTISEDQNQIEGRSAARLGYSDMGQNRRNFEAVRTGLEGRSINVEDAP